MIPGDVVPIYADAVNNKGYQGIATLIRKISDCGVVEKWMVEYEDQPEQQYEAEVNEKAEIIHTKHGKD